MGWKYTVMHLEREVATIQEDGLISIAAPDFMPCNLFFDEGRDISNRVNNLNNFFYWCATRVLTLDRKYAKVLLNAIGARQGITDKDRAQISLRYHCVTLTDVFWVKAEGESVTYAELNLYEHSLSDAFVEVSLFGRELTVQNAELIRPGDYAGDVSTQGAVPKAWIRRNGQFYLLKDGEQRDVEAELLASRVARCFAVDQVTYEPFVYDGHSVSACKLMTSLNFGIIPAEHVEIYAFNHDSSLWQIVAQKDVYGFHMMNIIDYLVGNTDRHWGNWGFLLDHRTNRLVKLYPLMDFNKSFLAYDTLEGGRCLTTESPMSQLEAALQGVRTVGINQTAEVDPAWFPEESLWEMFCRRLEIIQ